MEAAEAHNTVTFEPLQKDLNMEIIVDVVAKLRTIDYSLKKENTKKE